MVFLFSRAVQLIFIRHFIFLYPLYTFLRICSFLSHYLFPSKCLAVPFSPLIVLSSKIKNFKSISISFSLGITKSTSLVSIFKVIHCHAQNGISPIMNFSQDIELMCFLSIQNLALNGPNTNPLIFLTSHVALDC